ncbi:hypothetical protein AAA294_07535 [Fusobacterium varium]|uniref:hypothetical protein n=1 Tax=Fusobacterium varium TaxID=856 RepID=UPI0032C0D1F1
MKYHFASLETDINLDILYKIKPLYILASFFYLKKLKEKEIEAFFSYIDSKHCKQFILDSGAFTYLAGNKKNEDYILNNTDLYIRDYAEFIKKYNIKNYIELDLDRLLGYEKVKEIRKKLETAVGYKSMPVFHNLHRNKKDLDEILAEYDYICISNFNGQKGTSILKHIKAIVDYANKKNVKVHGLALTGKSYTKEVKFYSVDSSSWRSGMRYASIPKFDYKENKITHINVAKKYRMKSGKEVRELLTEYSMREWKKYQLFLDRQ